MANPKLFYFLFALFTFLSRKHTFKNCNHGELIHIPACMTDCAIPCLHARNDSLLATRSFGFPLTKCPLVALCSCYILRLLHNSVLLPSNGTVKKIRQNGKRFTVLSHSLIMLLLMISGNVHVHPGPDVPVSGLCDNLGSPDSGLNIDDFCFSDFCSRRNLGFLHINSRSLLPKLDQSKVWVHTANPDVLVISETWLKKSISNSEVNLSGYNLF